MSRALTRDAAATTIKKNDSGFPIAAPSPCPRIESGAGSLPRGERVHKAIFMPIPHADLQPALQATKAGIVGLRFANPTYSDCDLDKGKDDV